MNTQSNQNAPIEWLVVHHHKLNDGTRQLVVQHLVEPCFTAEVTERTNYEVKFIVLPNKFISNDLENHWKRKIADYSKSEMPKQFSQATSQS
jgi:hypothetical protein